MPLKRISVEITGQGQLVQFPSRDYMEGVTKIRLRSLYYINDGGRRRVLMISLGPGIDQGTHILTTGEIQSRFFVAYLGGAASHNSMLNVQTWETELAYPTTLTALTVRTTLDGSPATGDITALNPLRLEFEFLYGGSP